MKPGDLVQLNVDYWKRFPSLTVHCDGKIVGYKVASTDDWGVIGYVDVDMGWHGIVKEVAGTSVKVIWPNGRSTLMTDAHLTSL